MKPLEYFNCCIIKNLLIIFFLYQVPDRVCVTKHDGVFVLIVNAYPVDKGGKQAKASKDYKLTCKLAHLLVCIS